MTTTTGITAPNALNGLKMTPEAYLKRERETTRESGGKYELFNQTLIFMAGASEAHNSIASNILALIKFFLWQNNTPSQVFQSDMKVISFLNYKDYFYPDVVFIEGQTQYDDEKKTSCSIRLSFLKCCLMVQKNLTEAINLNRIKKLKALKSTF